jgi:hypothetical protein
MGPIFLCAGLAETTGNSTPGLNLIVISRISLSIVRFGRLKMSGGIEMWRFKEHDCAQLYPRDIRRKYFCCSYRQPSWCTINSLTTED